MNIEKNKVTDLILDLEKRKVKKLFQEISLITKTNKKSLIDELSLTINIGHKEIVFILNYLKGFKIISVEDEKVDDKLSQENDVIEEKPIVEETTSDKKSVEDDKGDQNNTN